MVMVLYHRAASCVAARGAQVEEEVNLLGAR